MQFSVEQIRSVRGNYLEPPYPGFSLEEVCHRRRMAQTKLVRGDNAWQAKGTAQTTEEWVQRLVQGSLNKMSDRNFEPLIAKLCTKELFATPGILNNVITIIFQKVLDEPENSKLYAAVCHRLSGFEVTVVEANPDEKLHSNLRDIIVAIAQREFKDFRHTESDEIKDLSDEDREFRRANFMRRKRANIRFVGELHLKNVISDNTITSIIATMMRAAADGGFPETENIELLAELFRTIGETLDRRQRQIMDSCFNYLAKISKRQDNPYPHRIRFKIMDLLDLRKRGWDAKPKAVKTPSSAKKTVTSSQSSVSTKKGKADTKSWRDSAIAKKEHTAEKGGKDTKHGSGGAASPPSSSLASRAADTDLSSPTTSSPATAVPAQKTVSFVLRVHGLFQEWVADCTNDFLPQWIDEFNNCDRTFANAEELCVAVAMEVIKEACTTTRAEAQREGCSFLIVGLYLMDEEMFAGFAGALAAAVEDGLLEDVPRFPERLMRMMRLISSEEEINADVYYDAANMLCMAYNRIADADEYTVDTLMEFWSKVPRPTLDNSEDDRVTLNFPVVYTLCERADAKPGLEQLISAIIESLHSMGIVEDHTIQEFLACEVDSNPLYSKIVTEYKNVAASHRA